MRITEYSSCSNDKVSLSGVSFVESELLDPVQINTPSLINNELVKQLSKDLSKIYKGGFLDDMKSDDVLDLQKSDLQIRSKMVVLDKWMVSILDSISYSAYKLERLINNNIIINSFDKDTWVVDGFRRGVFNISNFITRNVSSASSFIMNQSGLGSYYSRGGREFDENTGIVKNKSDTIVIGAMDDGYLGNIKDIVKKKKLSEKDALEYIFLHEFSHSIQRLNNNWVPFIGTDLLFGKGLSSTQNKFASDNVLLGSGDYNINIPYSVNLEVYADVRGILMFGKLHPEKFDDILSAVTEWRKDSLGSDHDTQLGLLKLKEVMVNRDISKITAEEIGNISRDLASVISLAKVKQYALDDVHMADDIKNRPYYWDQKSLIINRLNTYNMSLDDDSKKIALPQYITMIDEHISKLSNSLGIDKDTVNYKYYQKSVDSSGREIVRDRQGFEITGYDILQEKSVMDIELKTRVVNNVFYSDSERSSAYEYIVSTQDYSKRAELTKMIQGLHSGIIPSTEESLKLSLMGFRDEVISDANKRVGDNQNPEFIEKMKYNSSMYLKAMAGRLIFHLNKSIDLRGSEFKGINSFFEKIDVATDEDIEKWSNVISESRANRFRNLVDILPIKESVREESEAIIGNKNSSVPKESIDNKIESVYSNDVLDDSNDFKKVQEELILNRNAVLPNITKGWKERKDALVPNKIDGLSQLNNSHLKM